MYVNVFCIHICMYIFILNIVLLKEERMKLWEWGSIGFDQEGEYREWI